MIYEVLKKRIFYRLFFKVMYVYSVLFSVKCVPSKLSSFNFQHCHKCLLRSGIIRQKMAIKKFSSWLCHNFQEPLRFISSKSSSQNKASWRLEKYCCLRIRPPYSANKVLVRELYIAVFKQYRTCSNYWKTVTMFLLLLLLSYLEYSANGSTFKLIKIFGDLFK